MHSHFLLPVGFKTTRWRWLLHLLFLELLANCNPSIFRETCAGVFDPKWFWERIRQGGVSIFDVAPTGYDRLAKYFDEHIASLPPAQMGTYIQEMTAVKVAGVSGSLLSPHTQKRWTELRHGKPLLNLYGSTEMTLICSMRWENPDYVHRVMAHHLHILRDFINYVLVLNWTTGKGSRGEACGRWNATQISCYVHTVWNNNICKRRVNKGIRYISDDPTLTEKAFDEEGFFKSGDCAEKVGDSYVLHGRANIDGLKIGSKIQTSSDSSYSTAFLGFHHTYRRSRNCSPLPALHRQRRRPTSGRQGIQGAHWSYSANQARIPIEATHFGCPPERPDENHGPDVVQAADSDLLASR